MTLMYEKEQIELPMTVLSKIGNSIIVNIFDKQLTKEDREVLFATLLNDTENGFPKGVNEIELDNSYIASEDFYENIVSAVSCKDITPTNADGNHHQYVSSYILELEVKEEEEAYDLLKNKICQTISKMSKLKGVEIITDDVHECLYKNR